MYIKVFKPQIQTLLITDIKCYDERQHLTESSYIQPQCCNSDNTAVLFHVWPLPAVYITACLAQLLWHPYEMFFVIVIKVSMNNLIWGLFTSLASNYVFIHQELPTTLESHSNNYSFIYSRFFIYLFIFCKYYFCHPLSFVMNMFSFL